LEFVAFALSAVAKVCRLEESRTFRRDGRRMRTLRASINAGNDDI
jgi:hypothetical protein